MLSPAGCNHVGLDLKLHTLPKLPKLPDLIHRIAPYKVQNLYKLDLFPGCNQLQLWPLQLQTRIKLPYLQCLRQEPKTVENIEFLELQFDRRMVPRLRGLAKIADLIAVCQALRPPRVEAAVFKRRVLADGKEDRSTDRDRNRDRNPKADVCFVFLKNVCRMQWTRFGLEANDE